MRHRPLQLRRTQRALLGAELFGETHDVYFKVGLLITIGLAAKNALLIVEFAIEREAKGMGLVEATLAAARQRLRTYVIEIAMQFQTSRTSFRHHFLIS